LRYIDRYLYVTLAMGHHRQDGELRKSLGLSRIGYYRHAVWPEYQWNEMPTGSGDYGRRSPTGSFGRGSDNKDTTVALKSRPQPGDIHRPTEALPLIGLQLHFDDDAKHRLAVNQQHNEICPILSRYYIRQLRRLDANFGIFWQLNVECLFEQKWREFRSIAEQHHQDFVQLRRHERF
jgi:hypothetical protein